MSSLPATTFALRRYPIAYEAELPDLTNKSGEYHTHTAAWAEKLHGWSETILKPGRLYAQLLARVIEPHPGANKDHVLSGIVIRIVSFVLFLVITPFAAAAGIIALPLRAIEHTYRPAISFIDNSAAKEAKAKTSEELTLTKENPLSIRTHNVGLVTNCVSTVGDLRHPVQRAHEIVQNMLTDPLKPDVVCFQEVFHEDANKILCEGLKKEYPYIIHNVAPQISGFNSGMMVASKYPLTGVKFHRFANMLPPETMSPKGIIRVCLSVPTKGTLFLYGVHTQALLGERRAMARYEQLQELKQFMEKDKKENPHCMQMVMGDFNTSQITAWGQDNTSPANQSENRWALQRMAEFDDIYLKDHTPMLSNRLNNSAPYYLKADNERMGLKADALEEPRGSWFHGPFANPGCMMRVKNAYDRYKHDRDAPDELLGLCDQPCTWGTKEWFANQTANTARFDYMLFPKDQTTLDGRAEIRRPWVPKDSQSSSSDHLPVDGRIWHVAK